MTSLVRAVWHAPAADPPPPRRVWRDWVLLGVLVPLIVLEAALRPDVAGRWVWAGLLVGLAVTLLWRRSHPFSMMAIAFAGGAIIAAQTVGQPELFTTAYFLILLYALTRWGSGRAIVGGLGIVVAGWVISLSTDTPSLGDAIGGLAVVVLTTTLGFALRWRAGARARELDRVRLVEREQLARDLHDTVAHHVSAIAIQAQAGAVRASADPAAALDSLRVIEGEAAKTLDEMRAMVGALRHGEPADLAPTPTLRDLELLADGRTPATHVRIDGDPAEVAPTVAAAAFRIAQEAVTNARRHARRPTRVDVTAVVGDGVVRLEISDDGEGAASTPPGFGITGMTERAALLGGTCAAGPRVGGGWSVVAELPTWGGAS